MRRALLVACVLLGAGCSTVQPYQRGHLARPSMGLEVSAAMRAMDKTYAAKEAASGGGAVGAGGCGCN